MATRRTPYVGPTDLTDRRVTVHRGRRVKVEFAMSRRGIRKIALGQELLDACRSVVVQRAMPFAIRNSPRGRVNDGDGDLPYVASWRVAEGTVVLVGMKRVSVKLINVAPHAAAVEFINPETGRGHGYGVLAKTLAHLHGESAGEVGGPARRAAAWNPKLHPRGAGGRFVAKRGDTSGPAQAQADAPDADAESQVAQAVYDTYRRRRARR